MHVISSNLTIMVSDMDAAITFYTETLGFALKSRYGNHWADIEGPGITIGVHPKGNAVTTGNNLQIGLGVADLEAAIQELSQKGIECQRQNDGEVHLAPFQDPDGNTLYLVQPQW